MDMPSGAFWSSMDGPTVFFTPFLVTSPPLSAISLANRPLSVDVQPPRASFAAG